MKIVVFDIWGDYAHFKIPYTTTSPLTFPFPPKTTLYGILGAILGYDKNEYLKKFRSAKWKFGISVRTPISKIHIPENFINVKSAKMFARMPSNKSCRTQINVEFLKNPFFRIYVSSSDSDSLERLIDLLKDHKTSYTLFLGISECLANFRFVGEFEGREIKNDDFSEIHSIVPLDIITDNSSVDLLQEGKKFLAKIAN
jgi:CRISPR-associated protein Cas5h